MYILASVADAIEYTLHCIEYIGNAGQWIEEGYSYYNADSSVRMCPKLTGGPGGPF